LLPVAGELWGMPIYSYGLAVVVALGVCLLLAFRLRDRAGLAAADLLNFSLLGIAALLFASKFWAMILTRNFGGEAWRILLSPWRQEGFAAGPVAVATGLAWLAYSRWKRIPVLPVLDTLLPVVLTGLAIQRLGCFLAGCCFGRPTGLPWGVHFPPGSPAARCYPGEAVHPTQLYYLAAFLGVAGLLWLGRNRLRIQGMTTAAGFLGGGIAFAAITLLRGDLAPVPLSLVTTVSQKAALLFAAVGVVIGCRSLWLERRASERKTTGSAERETVGPDERRNSS
jgi:phosphatidylglycerol:prolipoprotein diacylglycerol transferase